MADVVKFNRHYTVIGPAVKKMLKCPYQIYVFLFRGKCYPSDRCADMINVSARSLHGNNAGSCSLRILTFKSIRTLHILQFPGIYQLLLDADCCTYFAFLICFFFYVALCLLTLNCINLRCFNLFVVVHFYYYFAIMVRVCIKGCYKKIFYNWRLFVVKCIQIHSQSLSLSTYSMYGITV